MCHPGCSLRPALSLWTLTSTSSHQWRPYLPLLQNNLLWLALRNRMQARDNLAKKRIPIKLLLCGYVQESGSHLFPKCSFTRGIWNPIKIQLNLRSWPSNLHHLWTKWRNRNFQSSARKAADQLIAAVCREGNARIFLRKNCSVYTVLQKALQLFHLSLSS